MHEMVKRITSLLERDVEDVIKNNIYFGNYPHILMYNNRLYTFKEKEEYQRGIVTADWACPIGVPIGIKTNIRGGKTYTVYVGYIIGDKIYVHNGRANSAIENLVIPTVNRVADITPPAWNGSIEELSSYIIKSAFFGIPEYLISMLNVPLTSSCMVDVDALYRDGWIVNQLYGRQSFCGVRNSNIIRHGSVNWTNRYFANVCKDRGVQVTGLMFRDNMPHPHIDGGFRLCTNEWEGMFLTRIQRGDYTQVFYLLTDFLSSYSSSSPYFDLPVQEESNLRGSNFFIKKIEEYYSDDDDDGYIDDDDEDY